MNESYVTLISYLSNCINIALPLEVLLGQAECVQKEQIILIRQPHDKLLKNSKRFEH